MISTANINTFWNFLQHILLILELVTPQYLWDKVANLKSIVLVC